MEIEKESLGVGEMAQWIRANMTLTEDLSSISSPQVWWLTACATVAPGDLTHLMFSGICIHLYIPTWADRQTYTDTQLKIKQIFF